ITHKLDEVMDLSDRVTVMRLGQVTGGLETQGTTSKELARLMVGRDIVFDIDGVAERREPVSDDASLLKLNNVDVLSDRGTLGLNGLSFEVKKGEILRFAGVDGNGQVELAEA